MRGFIAILLTSLWVSGCGGREEPRLVVFAAASLREVFTALAADFEREHPGVQVRLNLGGTNQLRAQLEQGAPCDVFASADPEHMAKLAAGALVGPAEVFAQQRPVVVVSREAASRVGSLKDLEGIERLVLGAEAVPIGRYSALVLERAEALYGAGFAARVLAKVRSRELNVRQVLTKVRLGEADAGIVYRGDALSLGADAGVKVVDLPDGVDVVASYPIAVATHAREAALAREWVALVRSPRGREALGAAGFELPEANAR